MLMRFGRLLITVFLIAGLTGISLNEAHAGQGWKIKRGKYLVSMAGCADCHTPGYFLGKPDEMRYLAGSDVGFSIPGLGVFVGRNLTPDKETGLGKWTATQIVTAFTKGVRPDGRKLAPIMPWRDFSHMTRSDAFAIAAYLKSLKPIKNKVAGPFNPNETPTVFVMTVLPPKVYKSFSNPSSTGK